MSEIVTERLVLRRFKKTDWKDLYEYLSDPEVVKYEPNEPFTREQAKNEAKTRAQNPDFWAVCLKSGKLIGNLYFGKGDFDAREIGYVFNRDFWGCGYAAESARALLDYQFGEMKVRRVVARCNPLNTSSWKLMERLGMRRKGTLIQNIYFKKDQAGNPLWADTYEYAVLESEWNRERG